MLDLTRVDYTLISLCSSNCMKILPSSQQQQSKEQQKVVIGDLDGLLQVFSIKKGEVSNLFRVMPCKSITCISLGGALGTVQDKIFVASKSEVRGFTKKGKMFLNFDTCCTDPIKYIHVSGSDLLVAGEHVMTHFHDCKDGCSYVCPDVITGIITLNHIKVQTLIPILASQDKTLKVLNRSSVSQIIPLSGIPTCIHLFNNDGGVTGDMLLCGTVHGEIILFQISVSDFRIRWTLSPDKYTSAVTCLYCYNLTGNDTLDLIVGRDDGTVEIYSLLTREDELMTPNLQFTYNCNESITSLQAGVVGNTGFDEVIVTTYSGWLFGLTTESIDKGSSQLNANISPASDEKIKISKLKMEIENLEEAVAKEREQYEQLTLEDSGGISTIPPLNIKDKLIISAEDISYLLSIEVDSSIDTILVRSDLPIDLLDVDKNTAVLSLSECDPKSGNAVLATYRCQANTTRLEFKFRTHEGSEGKLEVFVTPHTQPKCCQVIKYDLRPLCLHVRTHRILEETRIYNVVTIRGDFSLYEIHSWVQQYLLDIPEKPPVSEIITYMFESVLVGTLLQVQYSKGFITLTSDNISTISILQDFITRKAAKKKTKFDIQQELDDSTVKSTLNLIIPKLQEHVAINERYELLQALLDIQDQDSFGETFIPEYKDILDREKQVRNEYKRHNNVQNYLTKAVLNLFLDCHKYKGVNMKSKMGEVENALSDHCSVDALLDVFEL